MFVNDRTKGVTTVIKLDTLADALIGLKPVRVRPDRCLPALSPKAACSRCQAVCPENAVTLSPAPVLNDCSACGLCAAVCPSDAITLDDPSDQALLRRIADVARRFDAVAITCEPTGLQGAHLVPVHCLGRITPEFLVAAAACGAERLELVMDRSRCGACPHQEGGELLAAAVSQAQPVLTRLGFSCSVNVTQTPGEPHPRRAALAAPAPVQQDRRSFLLAALGLLRETTPARLVGMGPQAAAQPNLQPLPEQEWHKQPGVRSVRREMLRWAAQSRQPGADLSWPTPGVTLTGACHLCGVCMALCPNRAIAVVRTESNERLDHLPASCTGCGLCAAVCPSRAVTLTGSSPLVDLLEPQPRTLGSGTDNLCPVCGERFQAAVAPAVPTHTLCCLPCHLRTNPKGALAHA